MNYQRVLNADGTEQHVVKEGARYHVVSYALEGGKAVQRCSEPNCEINKHGDFGTALVNRLVKDRS